MMTKMRILVIDDQLEVRAEVKERIESIGFETVEAACHEEALQKLEGMQLDCVLLDLSIPVKLEGVPRIIHGKNLLQRIVSVTGAPPVIVITSHGLDGHKLAVEMMEIGAKSFVAKPFDNELESKIQNLLERKKQKPLSKSPSVKPFLGGALIMNDNGIELCEIIVGGVRGNAMIRSVVQLLSSKTAGGKYVKASAKQLAGNIPGSPNPASVIAAIKDFRDQCANKLHECGFQIDKDAVIQTTEGGYQIREWIQVRSGKQDELSSICEEDCAQVMKLFVREKRLTVKQLRDGVTLPPIRTQTALKTLEQRRKIKNVGGSGSMKTYEFTNS